MFSRANRRTTIFVLAITTITVATIVAMVSMVNHGEKTQSVILTGFVGLILNQMLDMLRATLSTRDLTEQIGTYVDTANNFNGKLVEIMRISGATGEVRIEAYNAIAAAITFHLTEFYSRYPQWSTDERATQARNVLLESMREIMALLNQYDLTKRASDAKAIPTPIIEKIVQQVKNA